MSPFKPLFTKLNRAAQVLCLAVFVAAVASTPLFAANTVGVGVGTGKIRPDSALLPGISYSLPAIAVFNSGNVESDYEMTVQFNETQAEQKPPASWVTFSPQRFTLRPGASQEVKVTIHPASAAAPGQYFAYLEARPFKKDPDGPTAINIAAATKLNFAVEPASDWQRIYYMFVDFWNKNQGVLIPTFTFAGLTLLFLLAKRFFKLERRRQKMRLSSHKK